MKAIRKRDRTTLKAAPVPAQAESLRLLNEHQVAEVTSLSVGKLRNDRSLKQGIPFVRAGGSVRYKVEDVRTYVEANRVETT